MLKGETTLPWWSYIIALILGAFVAPFSNLLFARLGNGIATNQLMKMVAGAVNPGRPVANLYVRRFMVLRCCLRMTCSRRARARLVLDVESRRYLDINRPRVGSEDGPISQDTSSCDVPHAGLGYLAWYVMHGKVIYD